MSAPASWTLLNEPASQGSKLVITDPRGESSVGIHWEAAAGKKLTKREIAQLMEKANGMPLVLETSGYSVLDRHEAWREVRTGTIRGSHRAWIRYSYHVDGALVQVIGTVSGSQPREARESLETIMQSSRCLY
jgi:hypothetical protein